MPDTIRDIQAGHFLAAFAPTSIGSGSSTTWYTIGTTEDGWNLEQQMHEEEVHDDAHGDAPIDTVNRGSSYNVTGILINRSALTTAGVLVTQSPIGSSNAYAGQLGSKLYGSLCLTPVAGTTAALNIGAGNSILFFLAAIANNINQLLANRAQKIQATFRTLPSNQNNQQNYDIVPTPSGVPAAYQGG
jgi:hypothetical protein